jgi:DNA-binding NarL/FixJ family response regulator
MYSDENYVVQVLRAGARGYLLKDTAEEDFNYCRARRRQGQPFFSPKIATTQGDSIQRLRTEGIGADSYDLSHAARQRRWLQE